MEKGTYGLETVKADQYRTILGYGVGYLTAEAYPLFAPYRSKSKGAFSGRVPRLLSIIFTTLVNTPSREWDAASRTLTIGEDFFFLVNKLGMNSGGDGRATVRDRLLLFASVEFPDMNGVGVVPLESTDISPDSLVIEGRRLVFSPRFVRMMTGNVRQIPLKCVYPNAGNALAVDLLALAALYCPDNRKLIVEKDDLPSLLPASRQSLADRNLAKRFAQLNDSQDEWTFRLTRNSVSVSPFGVYSSEGAVRLRRSVE